MPFMMLFKTLLKIKPINAQNYARGYGKYAIIIFSIIQNTRVV